MKYTDEAIRKRKEKHNKIKKMITIVIYMVLVPLLIYNISLIVQAVVNPNETPSFFGIKTYVIISGSMEPELQIGDIVIVKKIQQEELRKGDIISFRQGQSVITHRITEIITVENEKQYKTKGDNNNVEDSEILKIDEIEGKLIRKIPFLGKIALILQGRIAIIMIVIIFYAYLVRTEKIKNRKEKRKIKRIEHERKNSK